MKYFWAGILRSSRHFAFCCSIPGSEIGCCSSFLVRNNIDSLRGKDFFSLDFMK